MFLSVREHYASAKFHHWQDLLLVENIIREKFPAYVRAMEQYLDGTICYFGNIYIMRREVFADYCEWLFSVLEEYDLRANKAGYTAQELRVDGYLAERLLGIYMTFQRNQLKALELPRVHFLSGSSYYRQRLLNVLLPPGSQRRSVVKRWKNENQL